jgi:hypothetical protein
MDPVIPDNNDLNVGRATSGNKILIFSFVALVIVGAVVFLSSDSFGENADLKGMLRQVEVHNSDN